MVAESVAATVRRSEVRVGTGEQMRRRSNAKSRRGDIGQFASGKGCGLVRAGMPMNCGAHDAADIRRSIPERLCESAGSTGALSNQSASKGSQRSSAASGLRLVDATPAENGRTTAKSGNVDFFTPARLEALVAVAEEGSLSAAARRLHVSQPALSQAIGGLERRLGTQLFVRTNAGVKTTRSGLAVLGEARLILDRHARLVQVAAGCVANEADILRVSMPAELPVDVLRSLARFAGDHPAVRIQTRRSTTATQVAGLRSGALDVSFMHEVPAGPALHAMQVARERLGVLIGHAAAARLAGPNGIRLEALAELEWLGFPRANSPAWYDSLAAVLRTHGVDPGDDESGRDDFVIPSVMHAAVAAGHAFALVPSHWAHPIADAVSWIPVAEESLERPTWLVWNANCRRRDVAQLVRTLEPPESPRAQ